MPDLRRKTCRLNKGGCGRHTDAAGPISWDGRCIECSKARAVAAADDLHYHRGPYFERWRHAMAACVGGVLLDELEALMDADG